MGSFRRRVVSLFSRRIWLGSGESNLSLDVMRSRGCGYECRVWRFQAESGRQTAVIHRYLNLFLDALLLVFLNVNWRLIIFINDDKFMMNLSGR